MPFLQKARLLLLCTITCAATAQAQTPCSPALSPQQERVIATSLQKFEALKPLYRAQKRLSDSLRADNRDLRVVVGQQKTALALSKEQLGIQAALHLDARLQAETWKRKARGRWWLSVGLGALLLGGVAASVK